ncbi:MAG: SpoIID/LytB domain-containing protein [Bacillota bacterium]|nr:SpoIID/LytB domain-containing protein [Bacillota bacterium]
MFKRFISLIISALVIVTFLPASLISKAYAFDNSKYFNDLKVGLVSISSTALTITMNGQYTVNGQAYPDGTVFSLGVNGTNITLNGTSYPQISFLPGTASNLLTIANGTLTAKYMGGFSFKNLNGKILPINSVNVEDYLKGVVAYEMSDNFPMEALKSQAVAARNYALSRIGYEVSKGYDFDDTTSYQVYKGYNPSYANSISAVEGTRGQVLMYNGNLVETLYSAWHGGVSENSENVWGNNVPYLRSVQDSYESDPWPNGNRTFTDAQVQSNLVSRGYLASTDTFIKLDPSSITKYASGRVSNINIVYKDAAGVQGTKSITMDKTRTFLGLPSNMYNVSYDSATGIYTFSGKGNGHGLGMSQIGAKNRATAGQTVDQILKFYYQGTYLQNLIQKAAFSSTSLSTNSLLVGDKLTANSAATAGNGYGYLYKFVIKNGTATVLTADYSNVSSLDYVPTAAGSYTVEAYVKDKFSVSDFDDKKVMTFNAYSSPSLTSFTIDKSAAFVGQTVNATALGQSGSGSPLYKYEINRDGSILSTTDYSPNNQFAFAPDSAGSYKITAYLKDAVSSRSYDDVKVAAITVYDKPTAVLTGTQSQVLTGNGVQYNIGTSGGSGSSLFKFVVMAGTNVVAARDYSLDNTFTYVPNTAASYQVYGYVKDMLSANDYDAVQNMTLTVYGRPQVSGITAAGYFYEGKPVTMNSAISGGSPNSMSYRYEVYKNGVLVTNCNYGTSSSFVFTPSTPGTYTVRNYVKDALSSSIYDSMKEISITINSKPLYLSRLPLSEGMSSSDVTALQNALIKLGYPLSSPTGYFGSQTKSTVVSFQRSKGLSADGIVGSMTYAALNDALIAQAGTKTVSY